MRPQPSTKQIYARWKDYIEFQTPWRDYEGIKRYAKVILEKQEDGTYKEIMHAGYAKRLTKKQLKMDCKHWVKKIMPMLHIGE